MDTEALQTFLAIHETGGFSSAASRLPRSQPAISRRMTLLEQRLGMPLFDRVSGGVVLSEAGRVLLPYAQRVMAALTDGQAALDAVRSGATGLLSVALVGSLAGAGLTPTLRRFAAAHPGVDLTLRTATSTEVSDLVRRGEATLGVRYHHDPAPELECLALRAEPLQVVCSPGHPLAGHTIRSLHRLAAECWLMFPNAQRQPETAADNLFAQFQLLGIASLRWLPVDSLTAQKRLVEAGYGLAVLPGSAIEDERRTGTLAIIRVRGLALANPVCLVTRRGGYLSPGAVALKALLRSYDPAS